MRLFKNDWLYTKADSLQRPTDQACGSYIFVFYKNLHVTNISLAELTSLVRLHTKSRSDGISRETNFFSDEEYSRYLANVLYSLYPITPILDEAKFVETIGRICDAVIAEHEAFICNTVILNSYFTTALLHVPRSLQTNVQAIVFEAGYVHSAGHALYIRRIEKANQQEIEDRLEMFLGSISSKLPIFMTPYAHEFFTPWESKSSATSIRNGLDGIRIEIRKHHINGQPLRDYLNVLRSKFPRLRVAAGLRPYNREREDSGADPDWTIWLISDTRHVETEDHATTRSRDQYLIIYAQKYHNANQFVLFKERKPAWAAPNTLPHTLSISMVNIGRSQMPRCSGVRPVIVDPFCGTGTSLIDAALRVPDGLVIGLDRNPIMPRLVRDNLHFFGLEPHAIQELRDPISGLAERLQRALDGVGGQGIPPIQQIVETSQQIGAEALRQPSSGMDGEFRAALAACLSELRFGALNEASYLETGSQRVIDQGFSASTAQILIEGCEEYRKRLLFFVIWRGIANGRYAMREQAENIYRVILREFEQFSKELDDYHESLLGPERVSYGPFSGRQGGYSIASVVSPAKVRGISVSDTGEPITEATMANLASGVLHVRVVPDSLQALAAMERAVDLLVSDPPYGFNTHELEMFALHEFYSKLVSAAVRALKPRGQLLLAVPSYARNGKQVPYFQTEGALTRQVIGAAEKQGREVLALLRTVPAPKAMYKPPYYWLSTSAVSRKILWFTIQ
ncbi:MAG: hypothetical protein JO208_05490 [Alphaproteobacteria bacterium]|nr:hypothetical protein [Alphaproteobacteria bacterium]